jgi:toxin ParE1/3/4
MKNYNIVRTDLADSQLRETILYIAETYGKDTALKKLDEIEKQIILLGKFPDMGTVPKYSVLRKQGFKVLLLEKNIVFYKVNEKHKQVIVYAIVSYKQDYLNIINGL